LLVVCVVYTVDLGGFCELLEFGVLFNVIFGLLDLNFVVLG